MDRVRWEGRIVEGRELFELLAEDIGRIQRRRPKL